MGKTPDYVKKAVNNYRDKFDIIQIRFPKGTKDSIIASGAKNVNDYVVKCVLDALSSDGISDKIIEPEQPIEPEAEPSSETLFEDNTDHLLAMQAAIEAKKSAQDKAAEDAQRADEERIEREKAENVAEIMVIAERLRNGEELKEDPEKEQARNVSKVLANTQYYQ